MNKTWTGEVSLDWDNPANWAPKELPGQDDDVFIFGAGAGPRIGGVAEVKSVVSTKLLYVESGTLKLTSGLTEAPSSLKHVRVSSGGVLHVLGHVLIQGGLGIEFVGPGLSSVIVDVVGTLEFVGDANCLTGSGESVLQNDGTIRKTGGGISRISVHSPSNSGRVLVERGELRLDSWFNANGAAVHAAIFLVEEDAELSFTGVEHIVNGAVTGDGRLSFLSRGQLRDVSVARMSLGSGPVVVDGRLDTEELLLQHTRLRLEVNASPRNLVIDGSATLIDGRGSITVPRDGTLTWHAGTLAEGGDLNAAANSTVLVQGSHCHLNRAFTNAGRLRFGPASGLIGGTTKPTLLNEGVLTLDAHANLQGLSVDNRGTIEIPDGGSLAASAGGTTFRSSGTIELRTGRLELGNAAFAPSSRLRITARDGASYGRVGATTAELGGSVELACATQLAVGTRLELIRSYAAPLTGVFATEVMPDDAWECRYQPYAVSAVVAAVHEVVLRATDAGGSTPLANAWVYLHRPGKPLLTLHTDGAGRLMRLATGDRAEPWGYTEAWMSRSGVSLDIACTRAARPAPEAVLTRSSLAGAFLATTVTEPDSTGRASILVAAHHLALTRPGDLEVWPLLWQPPNRTMPWLTAQNTGRTYETAGLRQRAATWAPPAVPDGARADDVAPRAAEAALRPRGLVVMGTVEAAATAVTVEVLDRGGVTIRLRDGLAPAAAEIDRATAVIDPAVGDSPSTFTANVVLSPDAAAAALGLVYLLVVAQGAAGPWFEVSTALLTGVQLALVDDPGPAARGSVRGEEAEHVVVDFGATADAGGYGSPRATQNQLRNQTRARRMVPYDHRIGNGLLSPDEPVSVSNPEVPKPAMPLLMAELHLLGADHAALATLMRYRWHRREADPATVPPVPLLQLQLTAAWSVGLSWNGGDANAPNLPEPPLNVDGYQNRHICHRSRTSRDGTSEILLRFGEDGTLRDTAGSPVALIGDGAVPDATKPFVPPDWLEVDRRAPTVLVATHRRVGRSPNGPLAPATVIEWLPLIRQVRGGDGLLQLTDLRIGTESASPAPINGGLLPTAAGMVEAPPGTPPARLPRFRVRGRNPSREQVETLAERLTLKILADMRRPRPPHVDALPDRVWQATIIRIIRHESTLGHFEPESAQIRPYRREVGVYGTGHEQLMPRFGAPHGYGLGQLDNWGHPPRGATDDEVWNFVDNLDRAIRLILEDKAQASWTKLQRHPQPLDDRLRAIHQRETVRRYNGGSEFAWRDNQWKIKPSRPKIVNQRPNPELLYPNRVLDTGIQYWTGTGTTEQMFPWPIQFNQQHPITNW